MLAPLRGHPAHPEGNSCGRRWPRLPRRGGASVSAAQMRLECERSPWKGEGLPSSGKSEGKRQRTNCKNAPPSAGCRPKRMEIRQNPRKFPTSKRSKGQESHRDTGTGLPRMSSCSYFLFHVFFLEAGMSARYTSPRDSGRWCVLAALLIGFLPAGLRAEGYDACGLARALTYAWAGRSIIRISPSSSPYRS
jgi:hypothetical protein